MKTGDKIICVENSDVIESITFKVYKCPLIKGNVYVVGSIKQAPNGESGIVLLGITPPPEWGHPIFGFWRFRSLESLKETASKKQLQIA